MGYNNPKSKLQSSVACIQHLIKRNANGKITAMSTDSDYSTININYINTSDLSTQIQKLVDENDSVYRMDYKKRN